MGTQHGYTEKECKVCGVTKSREKFPAFGGRTCRECIRERDRENYPDRYERDKKNPRYVEQNRRRAREYKRKKKREREEQKMPDPPKSNDDNDDEEPVEVPGMDELLDSEWLDEAEDDMLLDRLGRGEDNRTLYDEMPDEDWELEDRAHDWKDDIEDTPLPDKLDPAAIMAEAERRRKAEEPPSPRTPIPEGTPMSAHEEATRLRAIAGDQTPLALTQQLVQTLIDLQNQVSVALGDGHSKLGDAVGPFQAAVQLAEELQGMVGGALSNLETVAGQIG